MWFKTHACAPSHKKSHLTQNGIAAKVLAAVALVCGLALAACGNMGGRLDVNVEKTEQPTAASPADFSYKLTNDKTGLVITNYAGAGGVVVVPAVIEGYPVVAINKSVFMGKSGHLNTEYTYYPANEITELVLPDTVTHIGAAAFVRNENLAAITLPAGLQVIPYNAFASCKNLAVVNLPAGVEEIAWGAFANCVNLTTANLPAGLKKIGGGAFQYCENLSNLAIPDSLTPLPWNGDEFGGAGMLPAKTRLRLRALGYTGDF
jgi:hypothetical protein